MPSSSFDCVKKSDVDKLGKMAAQYKRMSRQRTVRGAAKQAGTMLRDSMSNLIKGEPSLREHQNIADALHGWEDQDNVYIGLHPDHPLLPQAQEMHQSYQVSDVAADLASQSGEVEEKFLQHLQDESRAWYQKFLGMRGALG
jgi:hypothetical protein